MSFDKVSRRRVLGTLGASGTLALAGCLGDDDDTDDTVDDTVDDTADDADDGVTDDGPEGTVSIGVIQPMSGDLEYYGEQGWGGFLAGLAYKAGEDVLVVDSPGEEEVTVGDVTYELRFEDTEFIPDQAQTVAEDLVDDGVDILYGCSSSDSARQVIGTVTEPTNTLSIFGPAADADITDSAENCHDMVFRTHENAAFDAESGGRYAARETDIQRVYMTGAETAFGRSVVAQWSRVFEDEGLEIVGEEFVPPGHAEWDGIYDSMEDAGADAVLGGFTFMTLPAFLEAGIPRDIRILGAFATLVTNGPLGEVIQGALGEGFTAQDIRDAQLGPLMTRYHWTQYDNEINDAFIDMYTDGYGVVPDLFTSGSFAAASAIVQATEESASTDPDDIADAMRGMTIAETPKGTDAYEFQELNNQATSPMTVADPVPTTEEWAEHWPALVMPDDPLQTYDKEQMEPDLDNPDFTCDLS